MILCSFDLSFYADASWNTTSFHGKKINCRTYLFDSAAASETEIDDFEKENILWMVWFLWDLISSGFNSYLLTDILDSENYFLASIWRPDRW